MNHNNPCPRSRVNSNTGYPLLRVVGELVYAPHDLTIPLFHRRGRFVFTGTGHPFGTMPEPWFRVVSSNPT